jgi:amino-acid N-acetyltransferase
MPPTIRRATPDDLPGILALLESASLPILGVEEHIGHFLVAEEKARVVGAIGLEVYDGTALLRSAVVSPLLQGRGIGTLLYDRNLEHARSLGIRRLVLLTNTAELYFARRGFRRIDQKSVSGPTRNSAEFSGACPSHAVCMELVL